MAKYGILIRFGLLLAIVFMLFRVGGKLGGIFGLGLLIYKALAEFGILGTTKISKSNFNMGVVYVKDYIGKYSEVYVAVKEALKLLNHDKAGKFHLIGFYFDKPGTVPEDKTRYCFGIYYKSRFNDEVMDADYEKFVLSMGYRRHNLPHSNSLFSRWQYSNIVALVAGIKKFYKELNKCLEDKSFCMNYRIKDPKNACKLSIEMYQNDSEVHFFIPLLEQEQFMIYGKK